MLANIILMVSGTMSIGYLVHHWLYWRTMGATVPVQYEICTGEHMVLSLTAAGFIMAWFGHRNPAINMPLHILLTVMTTLGIGYLVHAILYRLEMHRWIDPLDDACSATDLLIALGIAGFVTSWL